MSRMIPQWFKPALWGGIVGAIAIMIIGFSADWVVTASTANQQAERKAEQAVIAALTPICVAQFKKIAKAEQATHLAALQDENAWQQSDYVEERGWATMPGSKEPNDEVADACAEALLKVGNKE